VTELTPDERASIAAAKYTVLYDGRLLPVVHMMDNYGGDVQNPMRAFRYVAYDAEGPEDGKWIAERCKPGEIAPIRGRLYA
jgi:hypothetical protein